jgi:serine protease inhibitor
MKRLYLIAIFGVTGASLLAAAIAFSPRKAPSENDKNLHEVGETAMSDQTPAVNLDPRLVAANSKFGFKLYSSIARESAGKNVFISPASVAIALAMTYNGAEAETQKAMASTLEFDSMSLDDLNRGFAALRACLTSPDPKVKLEIANSLWAKQGVKFKPAFIERNKEFFGAEVTTLDFGDPGSPAKINSWVKQKTNGKIDQIVDQIDPMNVLYLINAIYFKGAWQDEFKKDSTKDEPFTTAGGDHPNVPMMHQSGSYRYLESDGFQAVSLPYGGGRVSMYVFLPSEGSDLAKLQKSLTAQNWDQWMSKFGKFPGEIGIPRFKVEFDVTLNDALSSLGMGIAFDPNRANFRGMAELDENISISRVKHKTFCEVNEEGTEAAAVTSVEMRATSAMRPQKPFRMIVDRPFYFAIRDNQSGAILFMGSIIDPR